MVGHRYYNPEWGRWLTPDSVEYLDSSNINGLNLFSYCNNNPVMYYDGSGHFPGLITAMLIGFGVGFLVGGGFEIGKQIHNNGWNLKDWNWGQIGLSALGGGVAGAISAIPIPGSGFLSYLGTFFIGGVASVTGGLISGSVNSWETAALAFGIGAVANVAARGVSDLVKHIKVSKQINAVRANANRIASMSSKKKSLEIWNLIGTDNLSRNAFKSWGAPEIFDLLITEASTQLQISSTNNLLRYAVYSSIISSVTSGWF